MQMSNSFGVIMGVLMHSQSNITWCEELTHWKRPWCWERLRAGGEGDDRGWDGWMASPTRWTWVRVNLGSWWWTERPGALRFMGSQRVGHDWVTELNWWNSKSLKRGNWRAISAARVTPTPTFLSPHVQFISKSYLLYLENVCSLSSLSTFTLLP